MTPKMSAWGIDAAWIRFIIRTSREAIGLWRGEGGVWIDEASTELSHLSKMINSIGCMRNGDFVLLKNP
jgi:hypothetical protein